MSFIPIEIVNKILCYVSDINNTLIRPQYNLLTSKEYNKINFKSHLLWKIKSTLTMKKHYPLYCTNFSNKNTRELYKSGKLHYEKQLRERIII